MTMSLRPYFLQSRQGLGDHSCSTVYAFARLGFFGCGHSGALRGPSPRAPSVLVQRKPFVPMFTVVRGKHTRAALQKDSNSAMRRDEEELEDTMGSLVDDPLFDDEGFELEEDGSYKSFGASVEEIEERTKISGQMETDRLYKAKMEHLEALREAYLDQRKHFMGQPPPILSEKIKAEMYARHKENPSKWNLDRLALLYGLKKPRIAAIIRFFRIRERAEKNGFKLDDSLEKAVGAYFGVADRMPDKTPLAESRFARYQNRTLPEDAEQDVFVEKMKAKVFTMRTELPDKPPPEREGMDGKHLHTADHASGPKVQRERRGTLYLVERNDKKTGFAASHRTRMILANKGDGKVRTATWEERKRITKVIYPVKKIDILQTEERQNFPRIYDGWEVSPELVSETQEKSHLLKGENGEITAKEVAEVPYLNQITKEDVQEQEAWAKKVVDKFPEMAFTPEEHQMVEDLREKIANLPRNESFTKEDYQVDWKQHLSDGTERYYDAEALERKAKG